MDAHSFSEAAAQLGIPLSQKIRYRHKHPFAVGVHVLQLHTSFRQLLIPHSVAQGQHVGLETSGCIKRVL